jgi:hypothetical protein
MAKGESPSGDTLPRPHRSRFLAIFSGAHPLRRVVEHVYLAYDGGTPLVRLSRRVVPDRDPDLIASMFTAIQNFMDESFHEMGIGNVRSIELGDRHQVAFGRGKWLLLYVVYRGRESNQLERHVIHQVHDLEERFAPLLKAWDGDMTAADILRDYLAQVWFFNRDVSSQAVVDSTRSTGTEVEGGLERAPPVP